MKRSSNSNSFSGILSVFIVFLVGLHSYGQPWTPLKGPTGGEVKKIQLDASTPTANVFALEQASGSLYRSKDGGTNWSIVSASLFYLHGFEIDGTKIFAHTWGEVFVSTDAGANWSRRSSTAMQYLDRGIVLNKGAAAGSMLIYGTKGAWVSMDEGVTWKKIYTKDVYTLTVSSTGDVYMTVPEVGIVKHPKQTALADWDESKWTTVYAKEGSTNDIFLSVEVDRLNNDKVFITHRSPQNNVTSVFKFSTDKGATWTTFSGPNISNISSSKWFFFKDASYYATGRLLYEFKDAATPSFTQKTSPSNASFIILSIYYKSFSEIYAGLEGGGVWKSTLNATDWENGNGTPPSAIMGNPSSDIETIGNKLLLLPTFGTSYGYYTSENEGQSWNYTSTTFGIYGYGVSKKFKKLQDNSILIRTTDGEFRSTDGVNWTKVSTEYFQEFITVGSAEIYGFGSNGIVKKSTNAGQTWTTVPITGLPTSSFPIVAAFDGINIYVSYASGTQTIYYKFKKDDSPIVASKFTPELNATEAYKTSGMFILKGKLYIGDFKRLAISSDQAQSFKYFDVNHRQILPINQGGGAVAVSTSGNMLVTEDDGLTVNNTTIPNEEAYVTSLIKLASTGDYYASAYGSPALKFPAKDSLLKNTKPEYIDFGWKKTKGPEGGGSGLRLYKSTAGDLYAQSFSAINRFNRTLGRWEIMEQVKLFMHGFYVQGNKIYHNSYSQFYISNDNGSTFTLKSTNEFRDSKATGSGLFVNESTGTIFVSSYSGLYRSTNEGVNFTRINETRDYMDVLKAGNTIYAVYKSGGSFGLDRSTDDGQTWTLSQNGITWNNTSTKGFNFLTNAGSGVMVLTTGDQIYKTTDGGTTWVSIKNNLTETSFFDPSKVYVSPAGEYYFHAAGFPGKIYVSTNAGTTWTLKTKSGVENRLTEIRDIIWDGTKILAISSFRQGILVSEDQGETFSPFSQNAGFGAFTDYYGGNIRIINGKISVTNSEVLSVSLDQGETWKNLDYTVNRFLDLPNGELVAYGSTIIKSTDQGGTWTKTFEGQYFDYIVTTDGINFIGHGTKGTDRGFWTGNGLASWTKLAVTGMPAGYNVQSMAQLGTRTFVTVYNTVNFSNEMYQVIGTQATKISIDTNPLQVVSKDGKLYLLSIDGRLYFTSTGTSWTKQSCPAGARSLIFANNDYLFISGDAGKLWVSRNGGGYWQEVSLSSTAIAFNDVGIDLSTGIAYGHLSSRPVYKSSAIVIPNDAKGPALLATTPAKDLDNVSISGLKLTLTLDESPQKVSGKKVKIFNASNTQTPIETIDVSTGVVVDNKITFTVTSALTDITTYYVLVDAGAFTDFYGNPFPGISNSNDWRFTTLDATPPAITFTASNAEKGSAKNYEITVTDNKEIDQKKLVMYYRGITSTDDQVFSTADMSVSSGATATNLKATVSTQDSWFDGMGLEYYFEAQDASGNKKRSPVEEGKYYYSYIEFPLGAEPKVSGIGNGGTATSYTIIAIPHKLKDASIPAQFDELGSPNKETWRMMTYAGDNKYQEVAGGALTSLTRGKGYWINVKSVIGVALTGATTPDNNRTSFFSLNLSPGWNQIGNPYPVSISWSEVVEGKTGIGPLKKYANGTFSNATSLGAYEGGFVFVTAAQTLKVGFPGVKPAARQANKIDEQDESSWQVDLSVEQGDIRNELAGFGMNKFASVDFDDLDDLNVPVFEGLSAVTISSASNKNLSISRDVVPHAEEWKWNFKVDASGSAPVILSWHQPSLNKDLMLFDPALQRVVNMQRETSYQLNPAVSNELVIMYGDDLSNKIKPTRSRIGEVYPNPMRRDGEFNLPLAVTRQDGQSIASAELIDGQGRLIKRFLWPEFTEGFYQTSEKIGNDLLPGIYLLKTTLQSVNGRVVRTQRIIIQ